jgi:hypothetical protein
MLNLNDLCMRRTYGRDTRNDRETISLYVLTQFPYQTTVLQALDVSHRTG